jgi:transcriptional regulator with XRE-family HTH domain
MAKRGTTEKEQRMVPTLAVERLRARREERGISVRALADRVGVSASSISQIETGKANPSVGALVALTTELDLSLTEILARPSDDPVGASANPESPVLRETDRPRFQLEHGVTWDRLTPEADDQADFLYAIYAVGGASCPADALMRHQGREYGLLLSGRLGARVGFEEYQLSAGDSIVFNSEIPHRLWTIGEEPAVVVWTVIGRDADSTAFAATGNGNG